MFFLLPLLLLLETQTGHCFEFQTVVSLEKTIAKFVEPPRRSCRTKTISYEIPSTCTEYTDAELLVEARRPFEEKFSIVTHDIHKQSKQNIAQITELLKTKHPGFEKYLDEAKRRVNSVDENLAVIHATRSSSALAILNSGSVLSIDELVRRGILPPGEKLKAHTSFHEDGQIGEQDVVFFSIEHPLGPHTDSDDFGNIIFRFNRRIVDQGYFTPFAFGRGLLSLSSDENRVFGPCKEHALSAQKIKKGTGSYRNFIFSGSTDLKEWLQLSIAQVLWEKDHLPPELKARMRRTLDELQQYARHCDSLDLRSNPNNKIPENDPRVQEGIKKYHACIAEEVPRSNFADLYRLSGQNYPFKASESMRKYLVRNLIEYFTLDTDTRSGKLRRIFNSYQAMPIPMDGISLLDNEDFNWLELKVPRQVPLTELQSIEIIDYNHPEMEEKVRKAVYELASKQGRKVRYSQREGRIILTLSPPIEPSPR